MIRKLKSNFVYLVVASTTAIVIVGGLYTVSNADKPLARAEFDACLQKNVLVDTLNRQNSTLAAILSTARARLQTDQLPPSPGETKEEALAIYDRLIAPYSVALMHFNCEAYRKRF